jgi:hypothetical protein
VAPDANVLADAATDVDVLHDFPALLSLVQETAASAPKSGEMGLAVRNESGGVLWFLIASDDGTYSDLEMMSRAFVWPSYARARPPDPHLPDGDPFADAIRDRAATRVIVLFSPPPLKTACARAIELMLGTRRRRPEAAMVAPRHIGRILRDFEDAVARSDAGVGQHLLDEAWATGRLSLVNRSFLQIRLLTAQRAWQEVVDHALRHRVPDLDFPRSVEHDLIRAIYWAVLNQSLVEEGMPGAIEAFTEAAASGLGDVFRDHRAAASPEARQAWMVRWAAVGAEWPMATRDELLAQAATPAERAELEALATHVRFSANESAEFVRELLTAHEDAAAFSLADAVVGLPEGQRVAALVQAAARLNDAARLSSAAHAVEAAGGTPVVDAPTALVERVAAQPRPAVAAEDWATWLRALYEDPEWPDAVRIVDEQGEGWTEALRRSGESLDQVADLVEALAGEDPLRFVLPRLVRAVLPVGEKRAELVRARERVLHALAYAISEDPASGVADLDALADILAALLDAGVSPQRFDRLCDQVEAVWTRVAGPPRLARWVVDVLTILHGHPWPDESRRTQFLGTLVAPLLADAARSRPLVPRAVWLELSDLLEASELGMMIPDSIRNPTSDTEAEELDQLAHLANHTVLLHTLVPGAAERASDYLKSIMPSVRVINDSSHVGGQQLREQARNADDIVIASRASKHSASEFIRDHATVDVHWASGKGWSSLVDALRRDPALI